MPNITIKDASDFILEKLNYGNYDLKSDRFTINFKHIDSLTMEIYPKDGDTAASHPITLSFNTNETYISLEFKMNMLSEVMILFNKLLETINQM